jgi:putative hydrolase of the HAD superfamily
MSQISIMELLDYPNLIPTVIVWSLQEWPKDDTSAASAIESRLLGERRRDQLPLALIAIDGPRPVGYVSLIELQLIEAKGQRYWVDGLYVEPTYRGRGLASRLLQEGVRKATTLGLDHLSAYTTKISLYRRNGWAPVQKADLSMPGPIVMRQEISGWTLNRKGK